MSVDPLDRHLNRTKPIAACVEENLQLGLVPFPADVDATQGKRREGSISAVRVREALPQDSSQDLNRPGPDQLPIQRSVASTLILDVPRAENKVGLAGEKRTDDAW